MKLVDDNTIGPLRRLWLAGIVFYLLISSVAAQASRTSGLILEGTQWETPYYVIDSSIAGPTVVIVAGLHGNEPAGARAAEQVRHWPIARGKLVVVPQANRPGLERNTRWLPGEPKETRNANRNFPKSGPINGGLVRAAVERLGAKGFCFETTYQYQPLSARTRQHRIMLNRLVRELGMLDREADDILLSRTEKSSIRVALYDAAGTSVRGVGNAERVLRSASEFVLHRVGPADICAGVLSQFDVVVFPGGSGSKQAAAIGDVGRESVRRFVRSGGGYIGICAGAYLATAKYAWGLSLVNAKTFTGTRHIPGVGDKSMWFRGTGTVKVELTDAGAAILGGNSRMLDVWYANGPILSPAGREDLPDYVPLAWFSSEISKYEPQEGTMINTPAVVTADYGQGRVLLISPHPEATQGLESLVWQSVVWAARKVQPLPQAL